MTSLEASVTLAKTKGDREHAFNSAAKKTTFYPLIDTMHRFNAVGMQMLATQRV